MATSYKNSPQLESNTDFETGSLDAPETVVPASLGQNLAYLLAGTLFGIVLVKSEVISWFRIQEMFRLESFHMYGVIGSAVAVGALSVFLIKKFKLTTWGGQPIRFTDKPYHQGLIFGGVLFGLGWGITGACPGPLFAQLGNGYGAVGVTILSALAGTWVYGKWRERLPH